MHKFTKIAVSFLLILSIILNPFASVFDIRARAVDPATIGYFILEFIRLAAEGFVIGTSAYYSGAAADEIIKANETLERTERNAVISLSEGVGVYLSVGDGTDGEIITNPDGSLSYLRPYHVSAELGYGYDELSDEEKEFADFFVNYINTHDISVYGWGDTSTDSFGGVDITVEGYEKLRNEVATAYNEYATKKLAEEARLQSFIDMSEAGLYPEYDFGFVGPTPNFLMPSSVTHSYVEKDGFVHTIPYSSDSLVNGRFATAEAAESYAKGLDGVIVNGNDSQGYYFTASYTGYGGGRYIIYNGVVYYARSYSYTPGAIGRSCSSNLASVPEFINFVDVNGNTLASVYTGGAYAQGIYYNKTGEVALDRPQVTTIDDSDFTTTTGGGTVEIPRTEDEEIIGQAIGLGLINPDSALELNEDGTIAGADGLTIAKLQELIDMIAEGQLDFESIQEYLDLITKLVASGNYTATEQAALLENIKELEQAQAKSIEDINSAVTSIAAALTIEGDIDLDTPEVTIIDKFPFCLPFDLYYIFSLLCQEPKEPVFEIPIQATIDTGGLNYEIDEKITLDLTIFKLNGYDMVQIFTQSCITLLFIVCLIGATKKLMWK